MTDLLAAAEREERELERKLAAVRALVAVYREQAGAKTSTIIATPQAPRTYVRASGTQELLDKARAHLQKVSVRMSAKPLLEQIAPERAAEGLPAINAFSSALSRSPLFTGARGRGYGLAEWGDAEQQPNAASEHSQQAEEVDDGPM